MSPPTRRTSGAAGRRASPARRPGSPRPPLTASSPLTAGVLDAWSCTGRARAEIDDLRAGGWRDVDVGRGDGAVGDVGDGELEHRRDARPARRCRHAAASRDRHPRRARRSRAGRRRASARRRRCRPAGRRRRSGRRVESAQCTPSSARNLSISASAGALARVGVDGSIGTGRKIGAVDGVRRGVVDRDRLRVPDDLDVARVRLELDAGRGRRSSARADRRRPTSARSPNWPEQRAGREQLVRERDASRDAVRGRSRRARRGSPGRAASAAGVGPPPPAATRDRRASAGDRGRRRRGGAIRLRVESRAQVAHGDPFSLLVAVRCTRGL